MRGTGRTTRALEALPKGAAYITANEAHARTVRIMAAKLGRHDIRVIGIENAPFHRGLVYPRIGVDHYLYDEEGRVTEEQWEALRWLRASAER
jgi:hypothetical protein